MNSFRRFRSLLWVLPLLFAMQSCIKDNFDFKKIGGTQLDPNFAVPLIHSSLTIQDILKADTNGLFVVDSNKFITLVYNGTIFSITGDKFIPVPTQTDNQVFNLSAGQVTTLQTVNTVTAPYNRTYNFGFGVGPEIDSMVLKGGNLNISINSMFEHSGTMNISIPSATLNGVPFSQTLPLTYASVLPVLASGSFDLTGYDFDLTNGGASFSQLPVVYTLTLNNSGSPVTTSDPLTVNLQYDSLQVRKVFGYFGQLPLIVNTDSARVKIYDNAISGTIFFVNPMIDFFVSNSMGIPLNASFTNIYGHSNSMGDIPITGSGIPNPIPIGTPLVMGVTAYTQFHLDTTNCNIRTVLDTAIKYFGYDVNATTNPLGDLPHHSNFLADTSRFKVDVSVQFPLYGYADGYIVQDTVAFGLFNFKDTLQIFDWVKFKININNGFPMDALVQIYFCDSNYVKMDSLLVPLEQLINSAVLNSSGVVIAPTLKTTQETFYKERIDRLQNARKLLVHGVLQSTNAPNQNVKIYSYYNLDVKIGVQVQFNYTLNKQ